VGSIYDFNITPELGANALGSTSSTVGLIDAWFAARLAPGFGLKAGRFISPVALEPGANRHFIESPFVNTLLPNRDIGIEAFGNIAGGPVDYRLGVFNGTRNNTQAFSSDEADGDKTVAGRLTYVPFKKKEGALSKLSLGLGASVGNQRGVGTVGGATGLQNIATNGQQTLLSFRNATTGAGVIADGNQVRFSPSIEWYTGTPWSFIAEYAQEKQEYTRYDVGTSSLANSFTGTNSAWRATVGYVLTGEEATKAGVTPNSPFNWEGGTWGAFEVVARVSGINLANELFDPGAADGGGLSRTTNATGALAYGAGLNWYLNRNVRLLFNVEKTEFQGGGAPNATNNNGAASDELYLFTRFQLQF
jgi:phosphate-selective porin OprO/OprP